MAEAKKRGRPAKPKEVEEWKDIAGYEGHYASIAEAELSVIGKQTGAISHCLRGKTKTAHGNHWRYV